MKQRKNLLLQHKRKKLKRKVNQTVLIVPLGMMPTRARFGSLPKWMPTMSPHGARVVGQIKRIARCCARLTIAQKAIGEGDFLWAEFPRWPFIAAPAQTVNLGLDDASPSGLANRHSPHGFLLEYNATSAAPMASDISRASRGRFSACRAAATDGKYEGFKTATRFDGTSHNPQWLR